MKSRGLGDSIEKFTRATGIHSLTQLGVNTVGKIVGRPIKDCGCGKRKDKLNKMFPYKK